MRQIIKRCFILQTFVFIALFLFTGCPNSGDSGSIPIQFPSEQVVINYSNWLNDGGAVSWRIEPGTYRLEMTANNDGATAEWVGANCPKTQPMRELNMTCDMTQTGQLIVTNPTTFGLGKSVSVTVKLTKTR